MEIAKLKEFGTKYTAAWCSQKAADVAAFFEETGSLKINDGVPSVGRTAIAAAAQGFMTAFPDMVVTMDGVSLERDHVIYRWTLTGTNAGPGGTGKAVRISGYEEWTFGADGLIAQSKGHFDEAEYDRQLKVGLVVGASRMSQSVVVRLSRGVFAPEQVGEVRAKLDEGRASLEPALRQLRGLLHYYVAVDEQASTMVNVSVWTGLAEARQMDTLAPMLAQRAVFENLGVRFDPIRNYPTLWSITP